MQLRNREFVEQLQPRDFALPLLMCDHKAAGIRRRRGRLRSIIAFPLYAWASAARPGSFPAASASSTLHASTGGEPLAPQIGDAKHCKDHSIFRKRGHAVTDLVARARLDAHGFSVFTTNHDHGVGPAKAIAVVYKPLGTEAISIVSMHRRRP